MIELKHFDERNFCELIAVVPDARFLLQWAGPNYVFPLNVSQLKETLEKTKGEPPLFYVFKAINRTTNETVGHIQMKIDYNSASCKLARVLVFPQHRGKGFGKAIVSLAAKVAFEDLGLHEVKLGVFDFNQSAIATYKSVGFIVSHFQEGACKYQDESWNLIKMVLTKQKWQQ